jgi:hypothetical protein
MKEVKCKFVAVDFQTAELIQKAIEICDFDCELINVGDTPVQGTIEFGVLTTDDGLGKYLILKNFAGLIHYFKYMQVFPRWLKSTPRRQF